MVDAAVKGKVFGRSEEGAWGTVAQPGAGEARLTPLDCLNTRAVGSCQWVILRKPRKRMAVNFLEVATMWVQRLWYHALHM